MQQELYMLKDLLPFLPPRATLKESCSLPEELPVLNIANITATGFYTQAQKKKNISF
jgi:hypothetical protein